MGLVSKHPPVEREYFGVRYYFNSKFGVFAEDCAGILNIGLAIKL